MHYLYLWHERECDTTRAHGGDRTWAACAITRRCYHKTKRSGSVVLVSKHPYIPNPVTYYLIVLIIENVRWFRIWVLKICAYFQQSPSSFRIVPSFRSQLHISYLITLTTLPFCSLAPSISWTFQMTTSTDELLYILSLDFANEGLFVIGVLK
jgi:hypothetical protein